MLVNKQTFETVRVCKAGSVRYSRLPLVRMSLGLWHRPCHAVPVPRSSPSADGDPTGPEQAARRLGSTTDRRGRAEPMQCPLPSAINKFGRAQCWHLSCSSSSCPLPPVIHVLQGFASGTEAHWNHLRSSTPDHWDFQNLQGMQRCQQVPCTLLLPSILHMAPGFPFAVES